MIIIIIIAAGLIKSMLIRHYSEPDKGLWRTEFSITVSVKVNRAPDDDADADDAPDDVLLMMMLTMTMVENVMYYFC